jgi:regulatory protein
MRFKPRQRQPDFQQVFEYAVWLLARRAYTATELRERFERRFLPESELFASVLGKLQNLGLQSDTLAAESYVRQHSAWGRQRLRLELTRRGVAPELIGALLASDESEEARLAAALAAKLKGSELPTDYKERQKIMQYLARRGFAFDLIKKYLR